MSEVKRKNRKPSSMYGESGFQRKENDAYYTEPWVTRALISAYPEIRRHGIWECAAGRGDMATTLHVTTRRAVWASDLVLPRDLTGGPFVVFVADFLAQKEMPAGATAIMTNPPYDRSEEFIRHALKLTEPQRGVVVMLLRHEFDCAGTRVDLFNKPPFKHEIVLTSRPRWDWWEGAQKGPSGPRHNFSWFVWDHMHVGEATKRYAGRPK